MDGCNIRKQSRHCREAPLGSLSACKTVDVLDDIRWDFDLKNRCQFINDSLVHHILENGELSPCCNHLFQFFVFSSGIPQGTFHCLAYLGIFRHTVYRHTPPCPFPVGGKNIRPSPALYRNSALPFLFERKENLLN